MKLTNIKLRLKGGATMPLKYIKSLNAKSGNSDDGGDIDFNNLTPEQQMEIRKDLGLYYEQTSVVEKTTIYNNNPESSDFPHYAKISDDIPAKEDIISIGENTNFTLHDESGKYQVFTEESVDDHVDYYIVTDSSLAGCETGIYGMIDSAYLLNNYSLKYKGQITTVSKIDAKFLPEQESSIEPVTLLQVPTESVQNAVRSDYISDEDWDRLVNGETCVARYNSDLYLVTVTGVVGMNSRKCIFYGSDGIKFTIQYSSYMPGMGFTLITVSYPQVVMLQSLPNSNMTSEEIINTCGFTQDILSKCGNDIRGFVYPSGYSEIIRTYSLGGTNAVEFWTNNSIIVITGTIIGTPNFSCTVTPR